MFRKQNSAAISHPSLLTACQMALAVTSGLSRTCAVSELVTHYINAHDHRNLLEEAPMLHVGATGTNNEQQQVEKSHEGKLAILWNQQMQTDRTVPNNKPDIMICNKDKGTCILC
jgi:hypothetical protein